MNVTYTLVGVPAFGVAQVQKRIGQFAKAGTAPKFGYYSDRPSGKFLAVVLGGCLALFGGLFAVDRIQHNNDIQARDQTVASYNIGSNLDKANTVKNALQSKSESTRIWAFQQINNLPDTPDSVKAGWFITALQDTHPTSYQVAQREFARFAATNTLSPEIRGHIGNMLGNLPTVQQSGFGRSKYLSVSPRSQEYQNAESALQNKLLELQGVGKGL